MKILSVSPNYNSNKQVPYQQNAVTSKKTLLISQKTNLIKFGDGRYLPDTKKINASDCSQTQIELLGKYFHEKDDDEIEYACSRLNYLFFHDEKKSKRGYERLSAEVKKVQKQKKEWISEISKLTTKEAMGESNIVEQKLRVQRGFLNYINIPNAKIVNGILIYGQSREKEEFIKWIKNDADATYMEVQYDHSNPTASLRKIMDQSENAKIVFDSTKRRTILMVKDLDKLLTSDSTPQERRNLGVFKSFIENISEKYHTTIITKTDRAIDDFEDASIGTERFGLLVKLKDGITKEGKGRLADLREKVQELNTYASECRDKWYYPDHYVEGGGWDQLANGG